VCGYIAVFNCAKPQHTKELLQASPFFKDLKARGPDRQNDEFGSDYYIYHSRLAVMSDEEHLIQPMTIDDTTLTYNGEVYNYDQLGEECIGDTDAILKNFLKKGTAAFRSWNGDFSVLIYNKNTKEVTLARDHLGVKPLFYALNKFNQEFVVSTNLLLLGDYLRSSGQRLSLNKSSYQQARVFRYILDRDKTPFNEISQLSPGHYLNIGLSKNLKIYPTIPFWDIETITAPNESKEYLYESLRDAIDLRTKAAVPFGTLLSGGLDSGIITHQVKNKSGFYGSFYQSMPGGTNEDNRLERFFKKNEVKVFKNNFNSAMEGNLSDIIQRCDMPIGDSSLEVSDQVFKFASQSVKVLLSGDGADELFSGYIHHRAFKVGQILHRFFPGLSRKLIIFCIENIPIKIMDKFFPYNDNLNKAAVTRFLTFLKSFNSPALAYRSLVGLNNSKGFDLSGLEGKWSQWRGAEYSLIELLSFDLKFWGPNYSLAKIDKISLSHGVEVRVPFYDYRVVEWCLTSKYNNGNVFEDKDVLRSGCRKGVIGYADLASESKFPFRYNDHHNRQSLDLVQRKEAVLNNYMAIYNEILLNSNLIENEEEFQFDH